MRPPTRSRALAVVGCAVLALFAAPRPARAQDPAPSGWDLDLALGAEMAGGHTTYRIEGTDGLSSVASELEFPLRTLMLRLEGNLASPRSATGSRVVLHASVLMSPRDRSGSGTLKDSDWLSGPEEILEVGAPHDGKDIYSESDAQVAAVILEGRAAWEFPVGRTLVLAPQLGILHQTFEYDVRNVQQYGYGPYASRYTLSAAGRVLDYEVTYTVPYIGARAGLVDGRVTASLDAWYSPIATAEDRDDHLLRSKLSSTNADGTAWQVGVGARFAAGPHDFLQLQASTVRVSATGTQRQVFYGGDLAGLELSIPSKITSTRNAFLLSYVHRFPM